MIETIKLITPIITSTIPPMASLFTVLIAYKSYKLSVDEKKERSSKIMKLLNDKNKDYFNVLYLLSKKDFLKSNPNKIIEFTNHRDIETLANKFIKKAEIHKEKNSIQLTIKDLNKIDSAISNSKMILSSLTSLSIFIALDGPIDEYEENQQNNESTQNIINDITNSSNSILNIF